MQENKDPAIKLFGKEISLSSDGDELPSPTTAASEIEKFKGEEEETEKEATVEKTSETLQQDDDAPTQNEETPISKGSPENNLDPKTPSVEKESSKSKASKAEKDLNESTTTSQEKPLKKPDKILPCPRCNSMDTKFCYYNNYNVNQPRHFCKACQRYWTAGGTMRNVPVGAGRRKSKSSSSHYRHITISEALQAARIDSPNGVSHPGLKTNGRILNFGLDAPICESMASVLNLADKKVINGTLNGFHKFEAKGVPVPGKVGEKGDDCSSGSSVTVSNSMEEGAKNTQEPLMRSINGFPGGQMPCLPTLPWPYPWNSAMPPPPPIFCPPGFPMPFYPPPPFWNCSVPGPWNVPWLSPQSPSSSQKSPGSGPNSPLGKHSREGEMLRPEGAQEEQQSKQKTRNGCVLVPKTLRIDDPAEAAKSSIWSTLGIQNESMFKGFQSKTDEKKHVAEPSPVLRANPAALSRSLNFQESV